MSIEINKNVFKSGRGSPGPDLDLGATNVVPLDGIRWHQVISPPDKKGDANSRDNILRQERR